MDVVEHAAHGRGMALAIAGTRVNGHTVHELTAFADEDGGGDGERGGGGGGDGADRVLRFYVERSAIVACVVRGARQGALQKDYAAVADVAALLALLDE
jgi:hypothetical protein